MEDSEGVETVTGSKGVAMGVWVLTDTDNRRSVLYDSTSERAFGEGFVGNESQELAEDFLSWLPCDPRGLTADELDECRKAHRTPEADAVFLKYAGRDRANSRRAAQRLMGAHQ